MSQPIPPNGVRANPAQRISLCATIYNEADSVDAWLGSIPDQTRPPDEIILCDAGSTDGTIERIEQSSLHWTDASV